MNKKENDQLKKIEKLDQQLDNTISKIGTTKVKPVKISKKKLVLFMLIPFSIACVISAVTSFLLIDPFHWYTKPRSDLELQQEKTIKQINQQFDALNLASSLDNTNTIADLLFEMKNYSNIKDIVKKPNEIVAITSKKNINSKLSTDGEEINIKIIVRTGSLEKEINVSLLVIIGNKKVKQVSNLVENPVLLASIAKEIKTDGIKRVSNLVDVIKTIINENDAYRQAFNNINFDITNDKDDNEIIANGLKTLNVNFNFTENNKTISSSVILTVNLQGKSRKEINQYLVDHLSSEKRLNFGGNFTNNFYAQNTFANNSTYGKGAFIWKDMVIAKFLSSTVTLTGYFIFMTTIQTILSTNLSGLGIEGIGKSLFIILLMCSGGLAVMAFSDVVANLIGEAAGVREGMSSIKSTVAGGMMAVGAGKIAGKAFGLAKSKRVKRAMAMGGTGMADKSMNAMSSMSGDEWSDNEISNSQYCQQSKPLDYRHFWHATEGMSSRAGIVGLAGFGLGVTTLATSKLVGAARGGGGKGFLRQIGTEIATPFKANW